MHTSRVKAPDGYAIVGTSAHIIWAHPYPRGRVSPESNALDTSYALQYAAVPRVIVGGNPPDVVWHKTRYKTNGVIKGTVTHTTSNRHSIFFITATDAAHVITLTMADTITDRAAHELSADCNIELAAIAQVSPFGTLAKDDICKIPVWDTFLIALTHTAFICSPDAGKHFYIIHLIPATAKHTMPPSYLPKTVVELSKATLDACLLSQAINDPADPSNIIVAFLSDPIGLTGTLYTVKYSPATFTHTIEECVFPFPLYLTDYTKKPPKIDHTQAEPPMQISLASDAVSQVYLYLVFMHKVFVLNITRKRNCHSLDVEATMGIVQRPSADGVYIVDAYGVIVDTPYNFPEEQATLEYPVVATSKIPQNMLAYNMHPSSNLHVNPTHFVLHAHVQYAEIIGIGDKRKLTSIAEYQSALDDVMADLTLHTANTPKDQSADVLDLAASIQNLST